MLVQTDGDSLDYIERIRCLLDTHAHARTHTTHTQTHTHPT